MANTTNLILPLLAAAQAQKHVTLNESLQKLDALLMCAPKSDTTSAEPASPADGDVYILPAGKTGTNWGPAANSSIAHYRDGVWQFYTPREGFLAWIKDTDVIKFFDGASWQLFSGITTDVAGVCGGRPTLESGVPVSTTDQTAKTRIYFTRATGPYVGLYDGAAWALLSFAEPYIDLTQTQTGSTTNASTAVTGLTDTSQLIVGMEVSGTGIAGGTTIAAIPSGTTLTLSANATATGLASLTFKVPASTMLDIFGFNASGALKLEVCKWTNDTTRATALALQDGVWVKSGTPTRRLLGTVRTGATAGQTEMKFGSSASGGGAASLLLWSAYNRVRVTARAMEADANWNYATNTARSYNNSAGNRVSFVLGLKDDRVSAVFNAAAYTGAAARIATGGIGLDTTSAISSSRFFIYSAGSAIQVGAVVSYAPGPLLGFHYLQAIERADAGASVTFYGGGGADEALEVTLWM